VSPRVQYGTTCLIIRNTIGNVSCSDEWELTLYFRSGPHGARGAFVGKI
jgi:hypothetical protein